MPAENAGDGDRGCAPNRTGAYGNFADMRGQNETSGASRRLTGSHASFATVRPDITCQQQARVSDSGRGWPIAQNAHRELGPDDMTVAAPTKQVRSRARLAFGAAG